MDGTLARALLGVPTHATTEQIRRAFRVAAFDAHPDQGGDGLRFRQLVAARDLLVISAPDYPPPAKRSDRFLRVTDVPARPSFDEVDQARKAPAGIGRRLAAALATSTDETFDAVLARVMAA